MVTSRPSALKYPLSSATVNGAAGPSNFQSSENLTGCCAEEGPPKHAARMGATSPTRTIALRVWRIRRFLSGSLPVLATWDGTAQGSIANNRVILEDL